jgi:succinate dehydrogenase / fumarate reductase iron-sulfur subunit
VKQLTVLRNNGTGTWEQAYRVEEGEGMTVMDALLEVQEGQDPTLAFRYACHWGVCGSCAMLINGVPRLACRTKLDRAHEGPELAPMPGAAESRGRQDIFLEPLPNFPVIRDLVVDMRPFFGTYRSVRPWFSPKEDGPGAERTLSPERAGAIGRYAGCILCGACHGSCPEVAREPSFLGPAVLAKVYRFAEDPREGRRGERLRSCDGPEGWSRCRFYDNCRKVCPAEVAPDRAIGRAKAELKRSGR